MDKRIFTVIAGPCAIENRDQCLHIAENVKQLGAHAFRGGAYKPRSSPFAFQGLGEEGLKILQEVRAIMPVVTEATSLLNIDLVSENTDIIQIGSRNMHNVELLKKAGTKKNPIMLKRGYSALIEDEWFMAAKYISEQGNNNILMCERGIRTFEPYTRNVLDFGAIFAVKQFTDYPIIIDPSHATGRSEMIIPMSLAAFVAGADGIIVEVHDNPEKALCDGHQAITIEQFSELMSKLHKLINN